MGAMTFKRRSLKEKVERPKGSLELHVCGRAKVVSRNGTLWTIKCGTGCGRKRMVNIATEEGKLWLKATGRVKTKGAKSRED